MSSYSTFASVSSLSRVRICRSWPPPEQWTKVKELNVENREPCEIWRSGVNQQLTTMRQHMKACGRVINHLEKSLEVDRAMLQSQPMDISLKKVATQTE